jgi:hypothetical protein
VEAARLGLGRRGTAGYAGALLDGGVKEQNEDVLSGLGSFSFISSSTTLQNLYNGEHM